MGVRSRGCARGHWEAREGLLGVDKKAKSAFVPKKYIYINPCVFLLVLSDISYPANPPKPLTDERHLRQSPRNGFLQLSHRKAERLRCIRWSRYRYRYRYRY